MRAFIAINLPPAVRSAIWEAATPLRSGSYPVRWVAPDSIHLTLKFLGEVAPEREHEIVEGIEAAVHGVKPIPLSLAGFGAFPSANRPRVVWVGCEAVPALELLQHRLERQMDRLGFPVEGRPFRPHVTLGRAGRDARTAAFADFAAVLEPLGFEAQAVIESVDLMQSELRRDGARYTVRHRTGLEG